jgi:hypothetical protein
MPDQGLPIAIKTGYLIKICIFSNLPVILWWKNRSVRPHSKLIIASDSIQINFKSIFSRKAISGTIIKISESEQVVNLKFFVCMTFCN